MYSPEFCSLVPQEVNGLLILRKAGRGAYPLGVSYHKCTGKYTVASIDGCYLGIYDTPSKAFLVYKDAKEKYIKKVANKYKSFISSECYASLMKWTIEITD